MQHHATVVDTRFGQQRILARLRPVEGASVDDDAADRIAVAADELGQRVHHDVRAVLDRPHQIGRGQRVVDDQRQAVLSSDFGDLLDIHELAAGIGQTFDVDRLGALIDQFVEARRIVDVSPAYIPAEALEGRTELVDRAAIKLARGDEVVARAHHCVEDQKVRGLTRSRGERRRAALEGRETLLQHRLGGIHDAGIDVTERLEAEQRGGVIGVVENERRRLIDRRGARAGCGIRLGSGMDGEGIEAWCALVHQKSPLARHGIRGALLAKAGRVCKG